MESRGGETESVRQHDDADSDADADEEADEGAEAEADGDGRGGRRGWIQLLVVEHLGGVDAAQGAAVPDVPLDGL